MEHNSRNLFPRKYQFNYHDCHHFSVIDSDEILSITFYRRDLFTAQKLARKALHVCSQQLLQVVSFQNCMVPSLELYEIKNDKCLQIINHVMCSY